MTWLELALEREDWEPTLLALDDAPGALAERWRRALAIGASPSMPEGEPLLEEQVLRHNRERVAGALQVVESSLQAGLRAFHDRDFTLLFADPEGVVVGQWCGGGFAETARALRLQPGALWDERTRGTNAIGTALVERRPVAVRAAAHLAQVNHGLVCYASPVLDPWGDVLGVLDATSYASAADPFVGSAVFAAARAIEESLFGAGLRRAGGGAVTSLMGRIAEPSVIVGRHGYVSHANQAALRSFRQLGGSGREQRVARVRAPLQALAPFSLDDVEAAGRGQIRIPGVEVEPVALPDGRAMAWLLVFETASRPKAVEQDARILDDFVGTDPAVLALRSRAARLAASALPVLVLGETGTGKELVARGLHDASPRSARPFVPVNCGALTETLLRSELFGYVGGAFTGADEAGREGRIAQADGGTLFLDEVAEMPASLQALLLRFLEDGTYHRVGEARERRADVRLVAATCRDLPALVQQGAFRSDLYYRIAGALLRTPALRDRNDLELLVNEVLGRLCRQLGRAVPTVSFEARQALVSRMWPGNVRQLQLALHHALVLSDGLRSIEAWHLPDLPEVAACVEQETPEPTSARSLEDTRLAAVRRALDAHEGNVSAAARSLGIARSTVYRLLARHQD